MATKNPPKVGQPAPDFTLNGTDGKAHKLSDYRGQNVVLFFFPKAFTGTCETQISTHAHEADKFKQHNAVVLGVSTDQTPAQAAFAKGCDPEGKVVLLSDFRHQVVKQYGVHEEEANRANDRATFIIDKNGVVQYAHVEPDAGKWAGTAPEYEALGKLK
jgi:peroxiredoxin Q/BCP